MNEADRLVRNYSEAAESLETSRKNIEKNAVTAQQEKELGTLIQLGDMEARDLMIRYP